MTKKFVIQMIDKQFETVKWKAEQRGITIQELVRAVIIPEWMIEHEKEWKEQTKV